MQNLQTNEALLQHFQVEELEERLENKWETEGAIPRKIALMLKLV